MPDPLISLFTPSHRTDHLLELWSSLQLQNYPNFEWVILCNNGAADPPDALYDDPRIHIFRSRCGSDKVGALKKEACELCRGDFLLEMDHDDCLVPGTLPKVAAAGLAGAGFIYSDAAVFEHKNGKPTPTEPNPEPTLHGWAYHPHGGWEHYPVEIYGQRFVATRNFEITPRSLCEVFYAPDHLRCWSAAAYKAAGGHDPTQSVGDDHALICRSYIAGAKFHYLNCCGYLYRSHPGNTVKARQKLIREQSALNRQKYLPGLINHWIKDNELMSLSLAKEWKAGRWDPSQPCAFTHSPHLFGRIEAVDVLQFLDPRDIWPFFNWAWRSLVPGGYLHVVVPAATGRYADQNPLHRTRFNYNTFLYLSRPEFTVNAPGLHAKFDMIQASEFYPAEPKLPSGQSMWAANDMKMLAVDLAALHGQRWPGQALH